MKRYSAGKIFGIGLSRTGTTSLTAALSRLGIRAKHFPCDDVTYRELTAGQYSLSILERFDALTDTPVVPFYPQLDAAYPGSKFILTVRERGDWLRSVHAHWAALEEQCKTNPSLRRFADFIHACIYGSLAFNEDRFTYVYDLHLHNVRSYFAGRDDDLLVVDICGGDGWEPLCQFLDLPIPHAAFPHTNRSPEQADKVWGTIEDAVPPGRTFILVGAEQIEGAPGDGRRALPFLERDGQHWGLPASDAEARHELERMRKEGAELIVFTWSTFWWLQHYARFHQYLRSRYDCALESPDLVAFRLD